MKEQYEIVDKKGIVVNVLTPQDQEGFIVKPEDDYVLEIEGNTMWITLGGIRRETIDYPGPYAQNGWIKKKGKEDDGHKT